MDVATIRKFLHLLDLRKEDFAQELELQNIKGEITKKIRLTQGLEKDLDSMDIKIGKKVFSVYFLSFPYPKFFSLFFSSHCKK